MNNKDIVLKYIHLVDTTTMHLKLDYTKPVYIRDWKFIAKIPYYDNFLY